MKRTLNTTINRSKSEKNDEHYTQLADIENEVRHYRDQFRGMTVLCNCDDPRCSNFFFYDGPAGKVADFHVERFSVLTNGVKTTFGWIDFPPGCGAYKRNTTGDDSFPTTYVADTNATFLSRIPFECSSVGGDVVHARGLLAEDEYMVLRMRVMTNEVGVVTNCNYSKILGPMTVTGSRASFNKVKFEALIFNPTPNDPNLEYDLRNNLSTRGHGSWCP